MLNNKGFTLVELLAVLVILSIIVVIAVPTISSSLEKQKNKELEHKQEEVVSKVELKLDTIRNLLTNKDSFNNGSCCLSTDWLKTKKIITGNQAKDLSGGVKRQDYEIIYDANCSSFCS